MYDLGRLKSTFALWNHNFPGIQPFYAVKCNPDEELIRQLAQCGASFDCASPAEIDLVLKVGVCASRILYANPCKSHFDIKHACTRGVKMTTFDTVGELEKIAKVVPSMDCVLRLYACDPNARCQLSNKFGALPHEWAVLLSRARDLGLRVTGISFHVGSGSSSSDAFVFAIRQARELYDMALDFGYELNLIDLGGGFMEKQLNKIPESIAYALDKYGFREGNFKIIAEPGRFFAESCGTLFTKVLGVRDRNEDHRDYWISDSLYGSFNCILYDHVDPVPIIMRTNNPSSISRANSSSGSSGGSSDLCMAVVPTSDSDTDTMSDEVLYISTLFGPTCDGMDIVLKDVTMPHLDVDDWIAFKDMGAYTIAGACPFNGIAFPNIACFYVDSS